MRKTHTLSLLLAMLGALQAGAGTIVWDNAEGNRAWDIGKSINWKTTGETPQPTVFLQGNRVEFRGDAAGFGSLTIRDSLNKGGSGWLTIQSPNTHVSGNVNLGGGTLDLRNFACASKVELASENTATILNGSLTNEIRGSGWLTKEGAGTLTIGYFDGFHDYNRYYGDTTVNGGTLRAAADNAFGTEGDIIMNAGTLDLGSHRAGRSWLTSCAAASFPCPSWRFPAGRPGHRPCQA